MTFRNTIIRELRDFYNRTSQHQDPLSALYKLALLETRFRRMYMNGDLVDWDQYFQTTGIDLLEQISKMPAGEVAASLIESDGTVIDSIPAKQIIEGHGFELRRANERCNWLCESAQECIIFKSETSIMLVDIVKVSLESIFIALWRLIFSAGTISKTELLLSNPDTPSSKIYEP